MSRNLRKPQPGPLGWLLEGAMRGRIAIFLWRHYPKAFTVDEIDHALPAISRSRIQQVLQTMYMKNAVEREERETGNPGPNPFEYKLTPFLYRIFNDGFAMEK